MNQNYRTDGELLRAFIRKGEDAAFEDLVHRHSVMVRRLALRLCRRSQDADDVVQQVLLTLARRCHDLAARVSLAGWIYNTTLQVAMRQRRNAAVRERHERQAAALRRARAGSNQTTLDWADPSQGGVGLLGDPVTDDGDRLRRALAALPESYRDALILHHIEGYTVEETAALLDANPGTVAARLSRGRAILRERLSAFGVGTSVGVGVMLSEDVAVASDDLYASTPPEPTPAAPVPGRDAVNAQEIGAMLADRAARWGRVGAAAAGGASAVVTKQLSFAAVCCLFVCTTTVVSGGVMIAKEAGSAIFAEAKQSKGDVGKDSSILESSPGGSALVPEPTGLGLLGLAGALLMRRRSRP